MIVSLWTPAPALLPAISVSASPAIATGLGLLAALVLLVVGFVLGRRVASGTVKAQLEQAEHLSALEESERERMLEFLGQLSDWTNRYSGDVSDFQDQLVDMDRSLSAAGTTGENRFLLLLRQVMHSNTKLQERLEIAEDQLEQQTSQIESYLSEARTDGLTGLANRRALDQKLDELFVQYRNGGRSFVVCLIDIDHFKRINDKFGHPAGDQVLREVAEILVRTSDDADLVARFGGEEFAIVMRPPLRVAADKLNRVRQAIEDYPVDHGGKTIDVTVSMGVAEPREDGLIAPIVRRADEALYAAKNVGRNRVYFHAGKRPALVGAPETVE
ncbi:MAG: GGDEF domain-containing protein [Planctomycetota bacterium]